MTALSRPFAGTRIRRAETGVGLPTGVTAREARAESVL
jgi:hypothetical protein